MARRREPRAPRVAVLGGGAAGLSAAAAVLRRDARATVDVFEAAPRAGGVVEGGEGGGMRFELGPNGMAAKYAAVHELVWRELGLGGRVVERDGAARKFYVVRDGAMVALPKSVGTFLGTRLFSFGGKLRLLGEVFVPRMRDAEAADRESVDAFFRRRFGPEVAERVVDPAAAGIFSGVTRRMSMKHSFGKVWDAERRAGSVVRGLLGGGGDSGKQKKARSEKSAAKGRGGDVTAKQLRASFTFDGGLSVLTDALAAKVKESDRGRLRLGTSVRRLWRDERSGRWGVNSRRGVYDAVISTIPPHSIADVRTNDEGVARGFAELARRVVYAPVSVVVLAYKKADVRHPLDGFGVLVPSGERLGGLLGVTFSSSNYPGTVARDDELYVTAYVGGARAPSAALLPGAAVSALAARGVRSLLGVGGAPLFTRVKTWTRGIPQYDVEQHGLALDAMASIEANASGLFLAGNYRDGVGLPDALRSGMGASERALALLASRQMRREGTDTVASASTAHSGAN